MEASQLHTIKGKGIDRSLTKLSDSTKPSYFNNQITPDSKIAREQMIHNGESIHPPIAEENNHKMAADIQAGLNNSKYK